MNSLWSVSSFLTLLTWVSLILNLGFRARLVCKSTAYLVWINWLKYDAQCEESIQNSLYKFSLYKIFQWQKFFENSTDLIIKSNTGVSNNSSWVILNTCHLQKCKTVLTINFLMLSNCSIRKKCSFLMIYLLIKQHVSTENPLHSWLTMDTRTREKHLKHMKICILAPVLFGKRMNYSSKVKSINSTT